MEQLYITCSFKGVQARRQGGGVFSVIKAWHQALLERKYPKLKLKFVKNNNLKEFLNTSPYVYTFYGQLPVSEVLNTVGISKKCFNLIIKNHLFGNNWRNKVIFFNALPHQPKRGMINPEYQLCGPMAIILGF